MKPIRVYSTRWCGYCVRAKALLRSRGLEFEEISLDDEPAFRQKLHELTGGWTVPQIMIGDDVIGGYTELWRLDRSGQLDGQARGLALLALGAVPRAAARDARLLDRRAAAVARLAAAAVDLELLLHRPGSAVRLPVVA